MAFWQFATLLIVVNSAIWTHFDAAKLRDGFHIGPGPRDLPPHRWSAMVFLFWPVALPFYLAERNRAVLQEPRSGPPPRFAVGGLDAFAFTIGSIGLGLFGFLVVRGQLVPAVVGLVIAVAGVFGGRRCRVTRETERIELGELGFDQKGFAVPASDDEDGDEQASPDDFEKYFSNFGGPSARSEPQSDRPPPAAAPPPARPNAPSAAPPAVPSAAPPAAPPAGVPYDPPPSVPYDPPPVRSATTDQPSAAPPPPPPPPGSDPSPPQQQPTPSPHATVRMPPPVEAAGPRSAPVVEARSTPPAARDVASPPPARREAAPPPARRPPDARPPEARPAQAPPPSRRRPPAAAQRPSMPGYGVAKAKPSVGSRLAVLAGILVVLGISGWAAWSFYQNMTAEPTSPAIRPLDVDAEPAAEPADTPEAHARARATPPPTPGPTAEATPVEPQVIQPWLTEYNEMLAPLGTALDDIDFNGFDTARCQALRAALSVASKLGRCPDAEIEASLRPAFAAFTSAWNACRSENETTWSEQLLAGKERTHQTQVLMDRRYGYSGVLELELEGAIGVERSPESISGRYLLDTGVLPGFDDPIDESFPDDDFDDDGFDEDGFEDDGFSEADGEGYDEVG